MMSCELCERELDNLTLHHLIPRQQTRRKQVAPGPTIQICSACHRQIHSLFSNAQLAHDLNTAAKLKQNPEMRRFLHWVSKQNPQRHIRVSHRDRP